MKLFCCVCNAPLTDKQINALKLLHAAGFKAAKAKCEKCWSGTEYKGKQPPIKTKPRGD